MRTSQEAYLLSSYLTNRQPTPEVLLLYDQALKKLPVEFNSKQEKLWEFCIKHTWALKFVDAAMGLTNQYHPIRKRIFIMLAILETQPAYNDCFLPAKRSFFYIFYILFRLIKAILKTLIGKVLLWFI
jgi:hypothetical protein